MVFLAVLLFLIKEAEMSPNELVCDNNARVKLSVLNGLREHHTMKEIRVHELEREAEEAQDKIREAEMALVEIRTQIDTTREEAEDIKTLVKNTTTPELEEIEELEICSEDGFVADCCQVKFLNF